MAGAGAAHACWPGPTAAGVCCAADAARISREAPIRLEAGRLPPCTAPCRTPAWRRGGRNDPPEALPGPDTAAVALGTATAGTGPRGTATALGNGRSIGACMPAFWGWMEEPCHLLGGASEPSADTLCSCLDRRGTATPLLRSCAGRAFRQIRDSAAGQAAAAAAAGAGTSNTCGSRAHSPRLAGCPSLVCLPRGPACCCGWKGEAIPSTACAAGGKART